MYKPSDSSIRTAKRASALIPAYKHGVSNPFTAIKERQADCIGGILVIQAVQLAEDPALITVRHSIRFHDKQTNQTTPYYHYLGLNRLGDIIDLSEIIRAVNRYSYSCRLATDTGISDEVDELFADATRLSPDNLKVERLIDRADLRTTELHRVAYIDNGQLLNHVAPGRSMAELQDSAFEELEAMETSVV